MPEKLAGACAYVLLKLVSCSCAFEKSAPERTDMANVVPTALDPSKWASHKSASLTTARLMSIFLKFARLQTENDKSASVMAAPSNWLSISVALNQLDFLNVPPRAQISRAEAQAKEAKFPLAALMSAPSSFVFRKSAPEMLARASLAPARFEPLNRVPRAKTPSRQAPVSEHP